MGFIIFFTNTIHNLVMKKLNKRLLKYFSIEETGISKRTLQYWIQDYKQNGLKGLIRKTRSDAGKTHLQPEVVLSIEQLY